jgi:hypothetical protein
LLPEKGKAIVECGVLNDVDLEELLKVLNAAAEAEEFAWKLPRVA